MAEKKNFTIENYNGTDYDTLYPETNSGQVLLDSDARVTTGLDSGSTLDDALQSVVKDGGAFQVGDTLTTARTNLGDKWLLCNGTQITQADYPALVGLLGNKPFNWISKGTSTTANIDYIVNKTTATGDLFLARTNTPVNDIYSCYYSTDLLSWQSLKTSNGKILIWCVNGTWIISYATGITSPYQSRYYSGENMNFSNFVKINGINASIYGVAYWNGKYYINTPDKSLDRSDSSIFVYTDLSQAPTIIHLNNYNIVNASNYGQMSVVPDGVVVCGGSTLNSNILTYNIDVVNAQNSVSHYNGQITDYRASPTSIQYFNGYYYMTTYYQSPPILNHTLFRSTALNGNYSKVMYNDTEEVTANNITITDNYLITDTGYYIDKENNVYKQANPIKATVPILVSNDKYYTMVNTTAYQSNIAASANLPSVSTASGLYTYIKAKS